MTFQIPIHTDFVHVLNDCLLNFKIVSHLIIPHRFRTPLSPPAVVVGPAVSDLGKVERLGAAEAGAGGDQGDAPTRKGDAKPEMKFIF
jgi:hypothetical protein